MSSLPSYRPVQLLGRGCADRRKRVPTLTDKQGFDQFAWDDPLYFGIPGSIAAKYSNLVIQNATHLEIAGVTPSLTMMGYQPDNFVPYAVRTAINEEIPCDEWIVQCQAWKEQHPVKTEGQYGFVRTLSEGLRPDDVVVFGSSGQASDISYVAFRCKEGQRVVSSPNLGAMGFGIPAAVGAALASNKRVIVIEGDGSLQLNAQELETIKRLNLPIKIYVLCNGGYATIRNTSKRNFAGRDHGGNQNMPRYDYPFIEYVECDPDMELSPRLRSRIENGKVVPGRLEDVE